MPNPRTYFFYLSEAGRLYPTLDPTVLFGPNRSPPHGPVFLKDVKYLDFFFRRLRPNQDAASWRDRFPYVSMCMGERNLLHAADVPIVFHTLECHAGEPERLVYGGSLAVEFDRSKVVIDDRGYFYHPAPFGPTARDSSESLGLISSHIMGTLAVELQTDTDGHDTLKGHHVRQIPRLISNPFDINTPFHDAPAV